MADLKDSELRILIQSGQEGDFERLNSDELRRAEILTQEMIGFDEGTREVARSRLYRLRTHEGGPFRPKELESTLTMHSPYRDPPLEMDDVELAGGEAAAAEFAEAMLADAELLAGVDPQKAQALQAQAEVIQRTIQQKRPYSERAGAAMDFLAGAVAGNPDSMQVAPGEVVDAGDGRGLGDVGRPTPIDVPNETKLIGGLYGRVRGGMARIGRFFTRSRSTEMDSGLDVLLTAPSRGVQALVQEIGNDGVVPFAERFTRNLADDILGFAGYELAEVEGNPTALDIEQRNQMDSGISGFIREALGADTDPSRPWKTLVVRPQAGLSPDEVGIKATSATLRQTIEVAIDDEAAAQFGGSNPLLDLIPGSENAAERAFLARRSAQAHVAARFTGMIANSVAESFGDFADDPARQLEEAPAEFVENLTAIGGATTAASRLAGVPRLARGLRLTKAYLEGGEGAAAWELAGLELSKAQKDAAREARKAARETSKEMREAVDQADGVSVRSVVEESPEVEELIGDDAVNQMIDAALNEEPDTLTHFDRQSDILDQELRDAREALGNELDRPEARDAIDRLSAAQQRKADLQAQLNERTGKMEEIAQKIEDAIETTETKPRLGALEEQSDLLDDAEAELDKILEAMEGAAEDRLTRNRERLDRLVEKVTSDEAKGVGALAATSLIAEQVWGGDAQDPEHLAMMGGLPLLMASMAVPQARKLRTVVKEARQHGAKYLRKTANRAEWEAAMLADETVGPALKQLESQGEDALLLAWNESVREGGRTLSTAMRATSVRRLWTQMRAGDVGRELHDQYRQVVTNLLGPADARLFTEIMVALGDRARMAPDIFTAWKAQGGRKELQRITAAMDPRKNEFDLIFRGLNTENSERLFDLIHNPGFNDARDQALFNSLIGTRGLVIDDVATSALGMLNPEGRIARAPAGENHRFYEALLGQAIDRGGSPSEVPRQVEASMWLNFLEPGNPAARVPRLRLEEQILTGPIHRWRAMPDRAKEVTAQGRAVFNRVRQTNRSMVYHPGSARDLTGAPVLATTGYADRVLPLDRLSPKAVTAYLARHSDVFERSNVGLAVRMNKDTGKWELEPVDVHVKGRAPDSDRPRFDLEREDGDAFSLGARAGNDVDPADIPPNVAARAAASEAGKVNDELVTVLGLSALGVGPAYYIGSQFKGKTGVGLGFTGLLATVPMAAFVNKFFRSRALRSAVLDFMSVGTDDASRRGLTFRNWLEKKKFADAPADEGNLERVFTEFIAPMLPESMPNLSLNQGTVAGGLLGGVGGAGIVAAGDQESTPLEMLVGGGLGALAGSAIGRRVSNALFKADFNPRRAYVKAFTEDAGLPPEVAARKREFRRVLAGRHREISDAVDDVAKLGPDVGEQVTEYLKGARALDSLPQGARLPALRWRAAMDDLSLDLVEVGLVEGAMAETVLSNLGTYVPRLYWKIELEENTRLAGKLTNWAHEMKIPMHRMDDLDWLTRRKDIPEEIREQLGEIKNNPAYILQKRGPVMAAAVEKARLQRWLASSEYILPREVLPDSITPEDLLAFAREKGVSVSDPDPRLLEIARTEGIPVEVLMNPGKLTAQYDVPKEMLTEIQELLADGHFGNLVNALQRVRRGGREAAELGRVGGRRLARWDNQEWMRLPDDDRYGPLKGQFVRREVAEDMETIHEIADSGAFDLVKDAGLAIFKSGKVVWNPASLMRNGWSNFILADMAGLSPVSPVYRDAFREMRKRGDLFVEARRLGLFGGEFKSVEIDDLLRKVADNPKGGSAFASFVDSVKRKGISVGAGKLSLESLENFHEATEQFFKMALYINGRTKLNMGADEAAAYARKWIFDYRDIPEWVKWSKSSVFGAPFITFSYKAIPRVLENAIAVGSPKKLARFWKWPLMIGAWNEYMTWQSGELHEEGKGPIAMMQRIAASGLGLGDPHNFKKSLPNWAGSNQILIPSWDEYGRRMAVDLTYTLPWGDFGEVNSGNFGRNLANAGIAYPRFLEPSNPWLHTMTTALTGVDPFTGRRVIGAGSSNNPASHGGALAPITDLTRYYARLWGPSTLNPTSFEFEKLRRGFYSEVQGDPNAPGMVTALVSNASGFRPRPFDARQSYEYARRQMNRTVREIQSELFYLRNFTDRPSQAAIERKQAQIAWVRELFEQRYGSEPPPANARVEEALESARRQRSERVQRLEEQ